MGRSAQRGIERCALGGGRGKEPWPCPWMPAGVQRRLQRSSRLRRRKLRRCRRRSSDEQGVLRTLAKAILLALLLCDLVVRHEYGSVYRNLVGA